MSAIGQDGYKNSESPVSFGNAVLDASLDTDTLEFDVEIHPLSPGHTAALAAVATDWGAAGANLTTTVTAVCNITTGDISLHFALAPTA